MHHRSRIRLSLAVLTCLSVAASAAAAPRYEVRDLTPAGVGATLQDVSGRHATGYLFVGQRTEAVLWDLDSGAHTNLHAPEWDHTRGYGIGGGQQVGSGFDYTPTNRFHALLWNGAGDPIDLNPAGADSSGVQDTDGTRQVGSAYIGGSNRAILWNGSASGYTDLTPVSKGFTDAAAIALDGDRQVGYAYVAGENPRAHAVAWNSSAGSAVDLHPAGAMYIISQANDVRGEQQVGFAGGPTLGHVIHAILWHGTAGSAVDLHPEGYRSSNATASNGVQQAGVAAGLGGGFENHAMVWSGSAGSGVDLHQFLPEGFISSYASAIDDAGYVYGEAVDGEQRTHAIVWAPVVPEPAAVALPILAAALAGRRRCCPPRDAERPA